ncbi:MAG: TetR/AcrR family transcriptional regulator [Cyanobacteria bacterium REEB67]|nr:TetR/AcrR family transcriptional regulator [Cyanobacteria bacterium REEB67]
MARTLDQAKRAAILTAARSIFIKQGYATSKMSDIAVEAGVAQGTLYLYYESKEALAAAIGEDFFARLTAQFEANVRAIDDPEGVVALVDWALAIADQERVVLSLAKERKDALKSKHEGRIRLVTQIAAALAELMARGVIRHYDDVTVLAELVMAVMRRLLVSFAIFDDEDTATLKSGAVTMLQHALFDDVTVAAYRMVKRKQSR